MDGFWSGILVPLCDPVALLTLPFVIRAAAPLHAAVAGLLLAGSNARGED